MLSLCVHIYGASWWNSSEASLPPQWISSIYFTGSRALWGVGIAWITLACIAEKDPIGRLLNSALSWSIFGPLARITYMTFLTHFWVIWMQVGLATQASPLTHYDFAYSFLGNCILSYSIGLVFTIVFEMPIMHFVNLLTGQLHKYVALEQSTSRKIARKMAELMEAAPFPSNLNSSYALNPPTCNGVRPPPCAESIAYQKTDMNKKSMNGVTTRLLNEEVAQRYLPAGAVPGPESVACLAVRKFPNHVNL